MAWMTCPGTLAAAPENLHILRVRGNFMESREVSRSPLTDYFSRSLCEE